MLKKQFRHLRKVKAMRRAGAERVRIRIVRAGQGDGCEIEIGFQMSPAFARIERIADRRRP